MFDAGPEEWSGKPLRELTRHISRGSAPSYAADDTSIWAVSQKCVREGVFDLGQCRPHSEAKPVKETALLRAGDICINSTGTGTLGRVALWEARDGRYFADTHITVVRADPAKVHPAFLAAFLGMPSTCETIYRECVTGSTNQIELSKTALGELVCPLPPLDEQRRIANVLRSVDQALSAEDRVVSQLAQVRAAAIERFIAEASRTPPVLLSAITANMDAGWSPDCENIPALNEQWAILKTSAVTWAGYHDDQNKRLPERLSPRPALAVEVGDILITRAGPADRTGVVAMVDETAGRRMLSDKIIRVRVDAHRAVPLTVATILGSGVVQAQIGRVKSGMAASQTNISQRIVAGLEIPLPSLEEQQRFAKFMEALGKQAKLSRAQRSRLADAKTRLASDLFSGRVRVPE